MRQLKKGFSELIRKVLLDDDYQKLKDLRFSEIKALISYYKIIERDEDKNNKIYFNISFDKDKISQFIL